MMILPHDHGHNDSIETILGRMPAGPDLETVADIFHQMSDTSRLRIFWMLCHCEECVLNIAAAVGMSSPAVSHHLRTLKSAGLIVGRREGKEVYYKAAETEAAKLLHRMMEQLLEISCPGEGR